MKLLIDPFSLSCWETLIKIFHRQNDGMGSEPGMAHCPINQNLFLFSLIKEQLMATNKPSKIHGNAAPKKSLIILYSSFKLLFVEPIISWAFFHFKWLLVKLPMARAANMKENRADIAAHEGEEPEWIDWQYDGNTGNLIDKWILMQKPHIRLKKYN